MKMRKVILHFQPQQQAEQSSERPRMASSDEDQPHNFSKDLEDALEESYKSVLEEPSPKQQTTKSPNR